MLEKVYDIEETTINLLKELCFISKEAPVLTRPSLEITPKVVKSHQVLRKDNVSESISECLDINTANEEEWQQLNGIGTVLSSRLVNFRSGLGGFHSIAQIASTYGLPDETFTSIEKQLCLNTPHSTIRINEADSSQLSSHLYVSPGMAMLIIRERLRNGQFKSMDDLDDRVPFDTSWIVKITPYLLFE